MYSRNIQNSNYRVPQHYSGVAFNTEPSKEKRDAVGRPSAIKADHNEGEDIQLPKKLAVSPNPVIFHHQIASPQSDESEEKEPHEKEALSKQTDSVCERQTGFFDSDEALIAAIIILLMGSSDKGDSQTLLLLLLILLY